MEFPDLPRPIRLTLPAQSLLVESISPASSVNDVTKLPELAVAQRYQASIDSRLPNGSFKVLVNGHELQMNLPENARTGDQLNLLLVSKEPRLKFALLSITPNPAVAPHSSQLPTTVLETGADIDLSKAGRFLGNLTQEPNKASLPPPLISNMPLLSEPPMNSQQLPGLLKQALSHSGLFYENHQAQWIAGKMTSEQLSQEPQSKLTPLTSASLNTPIAITMLSSSDAPVHPQSLTTVQQQLNLLETGQLNWRGEVWPGQQMEWSITDHPPSGKESSDSQQWQSRLRLTLPKLGEVIATLELNQDGLRLSIRAQDAATLSLMRNDRQPLSESMAAAGLKVLRIDLENKS